MGLADLFQIAGCSQGVPPPSTPGQSSKRLLDEVPENSLEWHPFFFWEDWRRNPGDRIDDEPENLPPIPWPKGDLGYPRRYGWDTAWDTHQEFFNRWRNRHFADRPNFYFLPRERPPQGGQVFPDPNFSIPIHPRAYPGYSPNLADPIPNW